MENSAVKESLNRVVEMIPDGKRFNIMEVCGTHTMAIARMGVRGILGGKMRLVSGPGCPVCVTSEGDISRALYLANLDEVIVATFGDMVRVPSGGLSLLDAESIGARVRVVFSPMDAVQIARENPNDEVVFLGVGFETTAPTIAGAVLTARDEGVRNFSVLPMMKLVPPALELLCGHPELNIDGFILPGHVSAIIGTEPYRFIVERHGKPCVIAGFEDEDIADALLRLAEMFVSGEARLENSYSRAVPDEGNPRAREIMDEVFLPGGAEWRAIGELPESGLGFREEFAPFDANIRFDVPKFDNAPNPLCLCGDVILGKISPHSCPQFGLNCTPTEPLGPCMVSSEGACAAYFKYQLADDDWA